MPLVKARCTSCDGELQVDSSKDAAVCPYCGTPYIVEKAINNYIINSNDALATSSDAYVDNGLTLLKLDETHKASEIFNEMTTKFPKDWRGWLGLGLCFHRFTDSQDFRIYTADKIKVTAPNDVLQKLGEMRCYTQDEFNRFNESYNENLVHCEEQIKARENEVQKTEKALLSERNKNTLIPICILIVVGLYLGFSDGLIYGLIGGIAAVGVYSVVVEMTIKPFTSGEFSKRKVINKQEYEFEKNKLEEIIIEMNKQRNFLEQRKSLFETAKPKEYYLSILEEYKTT